MIRAFLRPPAQGEAQSASGRHAQRAAGSPDIVHAQVIGAIRRSDGAQRNPPSLGTAHGASDFAALYPTYGPRGDLYSDQECVNHMAKALTRDRLHTNTIEAIRQLVKQDVSGTYVWCSPSHLQTYLRKFEFRWNFRKQPHLMFSLLY
ncbi:transposase [Hyphomonas sp.]|uniref:transposase n=1 Tax=Hyphomonas sp. TaxID=87 RepID=UPI00391A67D6